MLLILPGWHLLVFLTTLLLNCWGAGGYYNINPIQ